MRGSVGGVGSAGASGCEAGGRGWWQRLVARGWWQEANGKRLVAEAGGKRLPAVRATVEPPSHDASSRDQRRGACEVPAVVRAQGGKGWHARAPLNSSQPLPIPRGRRALPQSKDGMGVSLGAGG